LPITRSNCGHCTVPVFRRGIRSTWCFARRARPPKNVDSQPASSRRRSLPGAFSFAPGLATPGWLRLEIADLNRLFAFRRQFPPACFADGGFAHFVLWSSGMPRAVPAVATAPTWGRCRDGSGGASKWAITNSKTCGELGGRLPLCNESGSPRVFDKRCLGCHVARCLILFGPWTSWMLGSRVQFFVHCWLGEGM